MASIWRASRKLQPYHKIFFRRALASPRFLWACAQQPLPQSQPPVNESFNQLQTSATESARQFAGKLPFLAIFASLFGFGLLDEAFADSAEETNENSSLPASSNGLPPPESVPPLSINDLQDIARREKARLEELLRRNGARTSFCPRFTVAVKGRKVSFRFQIPPSCEIPLLISKLVSYLGVSSAESNNAGSDMILRVWDSGVSWQLALARPRKDDANNGAQDGDSDDELCVLMFRPLISSEKAEIEFIKKGSFTTEELEALACILQLAGSSTGTGTIYRGDAAKISNMEKTIESLEGMGVKVYGHEQLNEEISKFDISWDNIAGYDYQKREIEDTILLALRRPEVYDDIAHGTRCKFETNRPRAVLFEGPPGTGKTSCARVIADQSGIPLLYVPLEVIVSKYYGESERLLGKVFSLADDFPNGAIVFLDEVDSVATARDSETHEVTRRLLSVLLRQIDGFDQDKQVVVIAATNRKQDLDPALNSRFDSSIFFDLPDQLTREAIVAQYAKHLRKSEIAQISAITEGMSGRDIRDFCQHAERRWASKIIRGQAQKAGDEVSLPPLYEYIESAMRRRISMPDAGDQSTDRTTEKPENRLITK